LLLIDGLHERRQLVAKRPRVTLGRVGVVSELPAFEMTTAPVTAMRVRNRSIGFVLFCPAWGRTSLNCPETAV
jgi:hypothetical protein